MSVVYVTVDGLELPTQLAGHPALEFCNTLAGWNGGARRDYLQSYEHLARWAGYVGLLERARVRALVEEASRHPRMAARSLQRADALREALYEVLTDGATGPAFDSLAGSVRAAAGGLRLVPAGVGARLELSDDAGLDLPLHAAAWSAGQLLASAEVQVVRACPGGGCGWLFLDHRGRRRWCTMARCGNRAKVRRFADRHRDH